MSAKLRNENMFGIIGMFCMNIVQFCKPSRNILLVAQFKQHTKAQKCAERITLIKETQSYKINIISPNLANTLSVLREVLANGGLVSYL